MTEPVFRKSSYSNNGDCVELGDVAPLVGMRDSKDPAGPVLQFTKPAIAALLMGAKAGEFDDLT